MFHVNMQPKSRKKFRDNLNTETSVETRSTGGNEHLSKNDRRQEGSVPCQLGME
jgi:hypothetical protein